MKIKILFLFLAVSLSGIAQNTNDAVPEAGNELKKLTDYTYTEVLSNRLTVVYIENKSLPYITSCFAFKTGAIHETDDINGYAVLLQKLFFGASQEYKTTKDFTTALQNLGGVTGAFTNGEMSAYTLDFNKDKINDALDLLLNTVQNRTLLNNELDAARSQLNWKYELPEEDPYFYLYQDMNHKLWKNNFSRKNCKGSYTNISNAVPKQLYDQYSKYYQPDNALLILCGDLEAEKISEKVNTIFSKWDKPKNETEKTHPVPDFDTLTYSVSNITVNDLAKTPSFVLGYQGPDYRNDAKAVAAAKVFAKICSYAGSKFQKDFMDSSLAAYAAFRIKDARYVSTLEIITEPKEGKYEGNLDVLLTLIQNIAAKDYYTADAIEKAKQSLILEHAFQNETNTDRMLSVACSWSQSSLADYKNFDSLINAVSADDITAFLKKYIVSKPYVVGALASLSIKKEIEDVIKPVKPIEFYVTVFESNSVTVKDSANLKTIEEVEFLMRINPAYKLTLEGFADWTGPADLNLKISQKRADSIKQILIDRKKIDGARITAIGRGELPEGKSEDEKKKQRIVKFSIEPIQ